MTVKEVIKALQEYPDYAPVMFCLIDQYDGRETDRNMFEVQEVNTDCVHALLILRQDNDD